MVCYVQFDVFHDDGGADTRITADEDDFEFVKAASGLIMV